jgi:hypothetical protein
MVGLVVRPHTAFPQLHVAYRRPTDMSVTLEVTGLKRAAISLAIVAAGCSGSVVASPGEPTVASPTAPPRSATAAPSASEPLGSPSPATGTAEDVDGRFRLTFVLPRTTWSADEAIEGEAVLALIDDELAELGVAGNGPIEFIFKEVGGSREIGPAWDTVCDSARLAAASPIVRSIRKSGGYGDDQPDADFYRAFFADPLVRLPAGDWDITAVAEFMDGPDCASADQHSMRATVRVQITD